ncbi:hypothetical protein GHJ49_10250 [Alistipes sp. dk3620]|uniref:hypothetical protein n=1 Tax=unclassified Alistipes TaxID=2608932 RepID=UPI001294AA79|nr:MULTISPECIES: hypothetical protein [unclassified Alistipes]MQX28014.1 hypothetical protein [Alistipes sp. dk3620]QGA22826.1 hypothetical protein GFH31_02620 [Alistipes sp. dk3624]
MKKTAFTVSLCFIVLFASAQHFRKIIENKYSIRRTLFKIDTTRQHDASVLHATSVEGVDNIESKSPLEKVLFGNTNAKVEFVVEPSFEGAYGIRVIKDSSETSSSLEVKRIINWKEVEKQMQKAFPVKGYTIQELNAKIAEREKMSEEERELSILKSRIRNEKREKESLKRYQVQTFIIPISDLFAEKLYAKFVSFIDDFKAKELEPNLLMGDGETTVFRCIVDQEIWTLSIPFKTEEKARELSDLCKQIVEDAEAGRFDESKYIGSLEYGQEDCN